MVDKKFVQDKTESIKRYHDDLEAIFKIDLEEGLNQRMKLYALERLFQLIVDEMIDINNHLIKRNKFTAPDDFRSTFLMLKSSQP